MTLPFQGRDSRFEPDLVLNIAHLSGKDTGSYPVLYRIEAYMRNKYLHMINNIDHLDPSENQLETWSYYNNTKLFKEIESVIKRGEDILLRSKSKAYTINKLGGIKNFIDSDI